MSLLWEKMKKIKTIQLILVAVGIAILIPTVITISRYVLDLVNSNYIESKNFYFNSNRLKQDNPTYQINNWSGVGEFTIDINVNSNKNNLLESNFDVVYDIVYTCSSDVICSASKASGVIYSSIHEDDFTISINPTRVFDDNESVTVYIEATSTHPYVETISATFQITVGKRGISYTIDDETNRPYALVNITNALTSYTVIDSFSTYQVGDVIGEREYGNLTPEQRSFCVSAYIELKFDPNILVLDTTSSILNNSVIEEIAKNGTMYINKITFPINAMTSTEVRFYKVDYSQNYTYPYDNLTSIVEFSAY